MSLQNLNFLVVDDLALMRSVIVNHLLAMGCEKVQIASDGVDALNVLRSSKIDVVLADWNMPVMSGLDLLRAVRANSKLAHLPFLMITAEVEHQHIKDAIAAGVSALLVKPFNAANLKARLELIVSSQPRAAPLRPAGRPLHASTETAASSPDRVIADLTLAPHILVVDDYSGSRLLMEKLFDGEYQVSTAKDGLQALAVCRVKPHPDLVLMDVVMPGMDGFEVVRRLREDDATAQIPVIFVSGLTEDDARVKGMALGAVDFLVKNSDPKAMRARVRDFIKLVAMRRQLQADFDTMLDAAQHREDAENIARHDLKGALAGILGMVQSLANADDMPSRHAAQLWLVAQTAQQVMNMVNLSGVLYKIESGVVQKAPLLANTDNETF